MTNVEQTEPAEPKLVTMNKRGRTTEFPTEYSREFITYAASCDAPVVDIGAAYGVATIPALKQGANVVAVDIDERHLEVLHSRTPDNCRERLTTLKARFPEELDFPIGSVGAFHASNLLNFLKGSDITYGISLMFRWLRPNGKVFTVSGTPYAGNTAAFIPEYERRKSIGTVWPGEIANVHEYSSHHTIAELPDFLHLLDDEVLSDVFRYAGFMIEKVEMYKRANLPDYLKYDGRENVGLIAQKPQ